MLRPKSKLTEKWANLLVAEMRNRGTRWTPEHKSFEEVSGMLKAAGLPYSRDKTQRWIRAQVAAGKLERCPGFVQGAKGLIRETRFLAK